MTRPLHLGVLASGSGSNLQALLDACASGRIDARVAVVIVNVEGARALERARAAGVPASLLPHKGAPSREAYDATVVQALQQHGVELVCLAGYMRLCSPVLLRAFQDRILNIHPSLLPSFPGLHAHRQALDAGVRISGCTVHVVDEGCDTGPIVVQAAVPVLEGDDEAALAARILAQEHRCYPAAVQLFAQGRARIVAEAGKKRVRIDGAANGAAQAIASPSLEAAR